MKKKGKKIVQISLRIEEDKLREYKKWLIDNGYRSINEHLNKVIDSLLEKDYNTNGDSCNGNVNSSEDGNVHPNV